MIRCLGKDYREFILLVRDDGSGDDTVNILADYAIRYPEKMLNSARRGWQPGCQRQLSRLMQYALEQRAELKLDSLYLMFCDQDDTWYEDKIARQVNAMVSSEAELTVPTPVLVHSDLQVVASDNTPIAESLADYQGLETGRNRFANMVISNLVTGCTALINEPLARRALPVPSEAIMHDWWLALVASAFGKVVYLDTPLIHYRQHGNNTIGAKERDAQGVGSLGFWRKVFGPAANEHLIEVAPASGCLQDPVCCRPEHGSAAGIEHVCGDGRACWFCAARFLPTGPTLLVNRRNACWRPFTNYCRKLSRSVSRKARSNFSAEQSVPTAASPRLRTLFHRFSSLSKRIHCRAKCCGVSATSNCSPSCQPSCVASRPVVTEGNPRLAASCTLWGIPAANRVGAINTLLRSYWGVIEARRPVNCTLSFSRVAREGAALSPTTVRKTSGTSFSISGSTLITNQSSESTFGDPSSRSAPTNSRPRRWLNGLSLALPSS